MKTTHFAYCPSCDQEHYDSPADRTACPSCNGQVEAKPQTWNDGDATSIAELLLRKGYKDPFEPIFVEASGSWGIRMADRSDLFGLHRSDGDGEQTVCMRTWRRSAFATVIPAGRYTWAPSNRALSKDGQPVCAHAAQIALDEIRGAHRPRRDDDGPDTPAPDDDPPPRHRAPAD